MCAYELQRAGHRVIVLEARNRTGGRVYTVRKGFASGQYAEGGGEFFDPVDTFMRLYVKRFGLGIEDLRTEPSARLPGVVYFEQRRRQAPAVLTGSVARDVDRFWSRVAKLGRPLDVDDPVASGKALDRHSAAWLLDSLHVRGTARALLEQRLRQRFAVEPDALSLLFLCQAFKRAPGPVRNGTGAFRVHGGNDQLTNALSEPLADLRLLMPATRIEIHPSGVIVGPRGASALSARFCVLAAPLPAIKGVDFVGDVPGRLGEMIDLLDYGSATRVMLQYARRFWRGQGDSGAIVTDLTFLTAWEATSGQAGSRGILTVAPGATDAVTYAREFPTTRNLLAADEIDDVYPGSRKLFGRGEAAAWNEAPSRGAAAVYAPGQVTRYWRTLRRRHGRLLLAGEHTDSFTGSMEGAVRSGRRAAATIQALL